VIGSGIISTPHQRIVVIGIQVGHSWVHINGTRWRYDNIALEIRIVMIVPVAARCPGIVPVEAVIIVAVVVPVAIIIIIQFGPALGIAYAHTRIAVGIIIFLALVTPVVLLFCLYVFVL